MSLASSYYRIGSISEQHLSKRLLSRLRSPPRLLKGVYAAVCRQSSLFIPDPKFKRLLAIALLIGLMHVDLLLVDTIDCIWVRSERLKQLLDVNSRCLVFMLSLRLIGESMSPLVLSPPPCAADSHWKFFA